MDDQMRVHHLPGRRWRQDAPWKEDKLVVAV